MNVFQAVTLTAVIMSYKDTYLTFFNLPRPATATAATAATATA